MTQPDFPFESVRVHPSWKPPAPTPSVSYKLVPECKLVTLRECPVASRLMDDPIKIFEYWQEHIATDTHFRSDQECFMVFMLNTRRNLMCHTMIGLGTLDTVLVAPREVFRPAIVAAAACIVVAHNHPSGDPTPSDSDIKVTRDLIRAGHLLKIDLLDHVIIGRQTPDFRGYHSLREMGYLYQS